MKEKQTIEDGVVSREYYDSENEYRVVHLLKEPTRADLGSNLGDIILNHAITDEGRVKGSLFKVTARRSYCIQNGQPNWKQVQMKELEFGKALKRSAIVNLSRKVKGPVSDKIEIGECAKTYLERWYGKMKSLQPNIVICGGTFNPVLNALSEKEINIVQGEFDTGMRFFYDTVLHTVFLDCIHPSAFRIKHCMEYTYFAETSRYLMTYLDNK